MGLRATQFKNFMVKPRTLTAVTTLSEADAGKTIFLNSTTEFEVTLPKPKAGLNFTFVVKAAPSGADYTVVTNGSKSLMVGKIITSQVTAEANADFNIYGASKLTFADGVSVVGDSARLISDGTYWYVNAFVSVYNAITLTLSPSVSPSASSSVSPSRSPSISSSISPSTSPSISPSLSVSISPSVSVSISPSASPSASPSISPSRSPSVSPSASPS